MVVEEIMLALPGPRLKFKAARQASALFFLVQPSKFQMQVQGHKSYHKTSNRR